MHLQRQASSLSVCNAVNWAGMGAHSKPVPQMPQHRQSRRCSTRSLTLCGDCAGRLVHVQDGRTGWCLFAWTCSNNAHAAW